MRYCSDRWHTAASHPVSVADSYRLRAFAATAVGPLRHAILRFYAQVGAPIKAVRFASSDLHVPAG